MYPFADGLVRNNEEWSVRNDTSWLEEVKMRIRAVLLAILVTAFTALTGSQAQAPSTLLIRGATIIDGLSDAPLRDRSLLIEGNIIRDLVPVDAAAPSGVQVLDLSGNSLFQDCSIPMCTGKNGWASSTSITA
jgi:hypothetical protein